MFYKYFIWLCGVNRDIDRGWLKLNAFNENMYFVAIGYI